MNGESLQLFKVFRVPVFPMSLNAVTLGALACLTFYGLTWGICAFAGHGGLASGAVDGFFPSVQRSVLTGSWPDENNVPPAVTRYMVTESLDADLTPLERRDRREELQTIPERYGWIFGFQFFAFLCVWSTFGVAICRILALRLARDEVCSIGSAWSYAWKTKMTALLFPAAVLVPVLFLCLCNVVAGGLASIPFVGWALGAALYPFIIMSTLFILLAIGVGVVSLDMIPGIIAVERKGTFDAAGKATNCITARPLSMLLYLVLVYVFVVEIVHGLLIERGLIETVISKTIAPFGETRYEAIAAGDTESTEGFASAMAWVHMVILKVFRLLLWGLVVSLVLGGFTAVFMILRHDVDGIDPSDVARDAAAIAEEEEAAASEDATEGPEAGGEKAPDAD